MTTSKPAQWADATAAIQNAETILIVTHISPDGDAIGSSLGLANALRQMEKDVTVAVDDGVPEYLKFLPGSDIIVDALEAGEWDVLISTDASDAERTGEVGAYGLEHSECVINLDHHVTNTYFGDIHLVKPDAVSATEIVFDWWEYTQITWHPDVAIPLLTGLVTDTIGFRTNSVTPRTLSVAQSLMQYGASLADITARTLDSMTYKELKLWKKVLPSAQLHGEVIEAIVHQSDATDAGFEDVTDAGIVGFLNRVNEASISVVFKEKSANEIKLSMRAKQGYDVASVAFELGGGGHTQAAGATIESDLETAREKVLSMLQEAIKKGSAERV